MPRPCQRLRGAAMTVSRRAPRPAPASAARRPRALLASLLVPASGSASAEDVTAFPPRPLFWEQPLADPSVVLDGTPLVRRRDGLARRHQQQHAGVRRLGGRTAAAGRPAGCGRLNGDVWAPELVRAADGTWLAYYSVPVTGPPQPPRTGASEWPPPPTSRLPSRRCTRSRSPARTTPRPSAASDVVRREEGLPRRGVIDPSSYVAPDGRRFLLYRTQGTPSSIRMVRPDRERPARRGSQPRAAPRPRACWRTPRWSTPAAGTTCC